MLVYKIEERPEVQRDMDLVRDLLLRFEQDPQLDGHHWVHFDPDALGMPERSAEVIGYHMDLLIEAGYLVGKTGFEDIPIISKMTWQGHEFLDNIRDPGIWNKTKERVAGLGTVALSVVAALAQAEVKKRLGLP